MQIAAYIRVSSKAQDYKTQRHAITELARRRGDDVGEWFEEKASGGSMARAEYGRLVAEARAGRLERLYVYALDRLSRTGIKDMLDAVQGLQAHGVEIISAIDPFDLSGPQSELVIAVWAWLAKQERQRINERIATARARLAAEGEPWGRPPKMTAAQRETAARMRGEGRTVREISAALGINRSVVHRAIKGQSKVEKEARR